MEWPARLEALRISRGLNMAEVAKAIRLKYNTYLNYEKGNREPGHLVLKDLASFYGVTSDYLIGLSNVRNGTENAKRDTIVEYCGELYKLCADLDVDDRNRVTGYVKALLENAKYKKGIGTENVAG